MAKTIKAPFNFVPVSQKVYTPDWANQISHDIPFTDGVSGTIDITITAQTPIFVRNGHTTEDQDKSCVTENYLSFSKAPDGTFFIPGTTIKGAIRNVLEIISFGKMRLDKKAKFAQREWDNEKLYTIKTPQEQQKMHCGWLKKDGDQYCIVDCGKPYRINHKRIDEYFNFSVFEEHFSKDSRPKFELNQKCDGMDPKTAIFKYHLLEQEGFTEDTLSGLRFVEDGKYATEFQENRVKADTCGDITGTIVFTGQPDQWVMPRKMSGGKFYEFVFPDKVEKRHTLSEEDFEHFKYIYESQEDVWKRAEQQLKSQKSKGIPVFFRLENGRLKDFGLAFLYKLPYEKTPFETLPTEHQKEGVRDLADCIFGYAEGQQSLKGRIQFTHALAVGQPKELDTVELILGSPKASYYPLYINQDGQDGKVRLLTEQKGRKTTSYYAYKTYSDGTISGWKRYVVRKDIVKNMDGSADNPENKNLGTAFKPLDAGTTFKGRINFHNLKQVELGALLSALTFHGTEGCHHQIGQAKSHGYGKVKIDANISFCDSDNTNPEQAMAMFENAVSKGIGANWADTPQMKELFTMAHGEVDAADELFKYMKMSNERDKNEFNNAKLAGEFLQRFTQLVKEGIKPNSFIADQAKKLEEECRRLIENSQFDSAKEIAQANFDLNRNVFDSIVKECESALQMAHKEALDAEIEDIEKLIKEQQFAEAKQKLEQLKLRVGEIGKIPGLILQCEKAEKIANGTITDIVPASSTGAFNTGIKKWINAHGSIKDEEISALASLIKREVKARDLDKKWKKNAKFWDELEKVAGFDMVEKLKAEIGK